MERIWFQDYQVYNRLESCETWGKNSIVKNDGLNELQQLNLSDSTFGSSPSAQTAFKSAQYIWNDDDEPQQPGKFFR